MGYVYIIKQVYNFQKRPMYSTHTLALKYENYIIFLLIKYKVSSISGSVWHYF